MRKKDLEIIAVHKALEVFIFKNKNNNENKEKLRKMSLHQKLEIINQNIRNLAFGPLSPLNSEKDRYTSFVSKIKSQQKSLDKFSEVVATNKLHHANLISENKTLKE